MNTLHLKAYIKFKQNALENQHDIATWNKLPPSAELKKTSLYKLKFPLQSSVLFLFYNVRGQSMSNKITQKYNVLIYIYLRH